MLNPCGLLRSQDLREFPCVCVCFVLFCLFVCAVFFALVLEAQHLQLVRPLDAFELELEGAHAQDEEYNECMRKYTMNLNQQILCISTLPNSQSWF